MNFLRGLTTTSSPSNAKAEAAGAPSNNDLGGFDPNSPTHKKKMSLDDGLDDEREELVVLCVVGNERREFGGGIAFGFAGAVDRAAGLYDDVGIVDYRRWGDDTNDNYFAAEQIREDSFVTPPAADSEHGGPARFSLTDSDAPFYSSSLPRGGSAPRNQLQFSSSQLSPQLLNDYNEGAATLFSETEENIDLEESHEDMFSEWRFELAGQLAEQPDLLQKMMQFMERIQRENKTLKQEKQQQMGRVNELLRDASDNLCKQVNDFLAEKEQQRQTELRNLRGSSKSSSSPSRGEAEGAPSDSSATVSSRELTEEGAVVGLGGGAAGRSAASAPPTAQNHDPRAKNERRRGVAERLAFFACVFPCIIVYRAFKYFSFLFTLGFFGFEYVVYQRSHSISNADAPPTAASSQLPAMLESYFCPKEGEGVGAPAGEDPDDLCVMSGPNCKFSGLTQYVTARTCKHLEILLLQKATKSPAQEESSQKMMTQQENIKVADVVSETLQTLTGAAPGGDACVPAVQRCADELLSYKHEYHSMMKEYNRATGEYRKAEHSLNMLRIYVTRRGPLLEDPAGCWAQTFTPEICCSPWYGPTGHPGCWDGVVTFEKCCTLYRTTDVISRHAGHATNALPKR
eukprot:g9529.t1